MWSGLVLFIGRADLWPPMIIFRLVPLAIDTITTDSRPHYRLHWSNMKCCILWNFPWSTSWALPSGSTQSLSLTFYSVVRRPLWLPRLSEWAECVVGSKNQLELKSELDWVESFVCLLTWATQAACLEIKDSLREHEKNHHPKIDATWNLEFDFGLHCHRCMNHKSKQFGGIWKACNIAL